MILETLPQLEKLSDEQREVLAVELLQSVRDRQKVKEVDPDLVALLDERRAELLEHPDRVRSWPEVKASLLAKYRAH